MKNYIAEEIQKRIETGSYFSKEELCRLRDQLNILVKLPYDGAISKITDDMNILLKDMYELSSINGMSTFISTPSHLIKMYIGKSVHEEEITENTVFDMASITKFFTTLLTLKLSSFHILSLEEKVEDILPSYHLEDYTIFDLLKMCGEIRTRKRVDTAKNKEEATFYLESAYLYEKDKGFHKYSDIGMMILPFILTKKVEEKMNTKMSYEEILTTFLLKPCHLVHTGYLSKEHVAGNGRKDTLVHDPKARAMGGISGSAGLFSNGNDLLLLGKSLFYENYLSNFYLSLLSTNFYKDGKGIGGIYQKMPDFRKTYVPPIYSEKSIASEGFTGSVVTYDFINRVHNSFLVDAIGMGENTKSASFSSYFSTFQKEMSYQTVLLDCFDKIHKEKTKHL